MTQEEKQLLLKDLCARLPYYTELYSNVADGNWAILTPVVISNLMSATDKLVIKPYLRTMNSMTDEEIKELGDCVTIYDQVDIMLFHHLDCRGLIEKGLAIKAPEGMYED